MPGDGRTRFYNVGTGQGVFTFSVGIIIRNSCIQSGNIPRFYNAASIIIGVVDILRTPADGL